MIHWGSGVSRMPILNLSHSIFSSKLYRSLCNTESIGSSSDVVVMGSFSDIILISIFPLSVASASLLVF